MEHVGFALPFQTVFYTPHYLALALGCFAEEGLEVEQAIPAPPNGVARALLAGEADVGLSGPIRALVADIAIDAMPAEARGHAALIVADTVGAMLGGALEPEIRRLHAGTDRAPGAATVVAPGFPRIELWWAIVANGTAGTMLELDETVLVTAAGSGVGSAAVQIARDAGARVIATAGSAAKRQRLRGLGVDAIVDHGRRPDWPEEVRRVTGGAGLDCVFEHVGGSVWTAALSLVRRGGRVVTCGAHGGERVDLDLIDLFRRQVTLLGSYSAPTRAVLEVVRLVAGGVFQPVVHATLPLVDAARAHAMLAAREAFGKLVLVPA